VIQFNGKKLLNGTGETMDFQVGIYNNEFQDRIQYAPQATDTSIASLGVDGLAVNSKAASQEGLQTIDEAIRKVSASRAELGALQNRLQSTVNNLMVTDENLSAANSRIRDVDVASETSELTKNNILTASGTSVLAQANSNNQSALKLLS